jgi:ArsR family transcriptional regulator
MARRATRIEPELLEQAAEVIKCLGHPLRLMLLEALESGDKTVSELQDYCGSTQAMMSQQLATLRGHGVVAAHRDGQFIRYSISEPKVHHILACIRGCGT